MKNLLATLLLPLVFAGCAAAPPGPASGTWFNDHLFAQPAKRVDAGGLFAVNEGMRRFIETVVLSQSRTNGRPQALVDALRVKGELRIDYDAGPTRSAAEAFDAKAGNCLSLVIMAAALAKEMGLAVHYQSVYVPDTWDRSGDTHFAIGHVNLTLGSKQSSIGSRLKDGDPLTIDFVPPRELRRMTWRVIGEETIVAMYLNNRAAEALTRNQVDEAYWWVREAIVKDRDFLAAYNTLGVVYQRGRHHAQAAQVLGHVLEREPRNTHVMSNLVTVLGALDRADEAKALSVRLAQLDPDPAFAFFNRGMAAMRVGDFAAARDLFAKEVSRAPHYHEFHFGLAAAYAGLGDAEKARRHLTLAKDSSQTRRHQDLYHAKLERFRAYSR